MTRSDVTTRLDRLADQVGAVTGPAVHAERLVALAHDTRDRDVWGGDRAITYWDRLPDRVRTACYAGPTLAAWWERMSRQLGCSPPSLSTDRALLAATLACGDDAAVLDELRRHTEALCLRVRLAVQLDRDLRTTKTTSTPTEESML